MATLVRVLILAMVLAVVSCARPAALQAGPGVELTPLRTISRLESQALLAAAGVRGVEPAYDVDCYRMTYRANAAVLTGLLALPRGTHARRLVSFQHGTTTSRDRVPSALDGAGQAAAVLIAGSGYALIMPDYEGLGGSGGPHPYLVADSAAAAVVAMIQSARSVEGVPDGPVFLSGFSQGGQATLAAMRMLEAAGEPVLGAAPVAGPYDIRDVSLGVALTGQAPSDALYLAYMSWGYAAYYDQPLESVLTPDYAGVADNLFSTPHEGRAIMEALPREPRAMFSASFLDAFDNNGEHWLLTRLGQSDVSDWTPRAPVRLYYGSADIDVAPEEALHAQRSMRARGADVRAVDVGPVGHDPSMLAAAPLILAWLAELDAQGAGPVVAAPRLR
ncbi:lipase family protein [Terricaulis sp.]|uniref:alpha/beta hydrolase n=1 Tax=Terricaulis sp. TaxID=2768686 RepID=UPI0037833102